MLENSPDTGIFALPCSEKLEKKTELFPFDGGAEIRTVKPVRGRDSCLKKTAEN